MMRSPILVVVALVSLAAGAGAVWLLKSRASSPPPLIATIENLGHLVTVRANVADVIRISKPRAMDVPGTGYEIRYGGTTVLLIAKGDCSIATDMRMAKYESIDTSNRTIRVVLPAPTLFSVRVNHAPATQGGSELYELTNDGLEAIIPDDSNRKGAIDKAYGEAEKRIRSACTRPDILGQAKQNTEAILAGLFTPVGWTATVEWR